MLQDRRLVIRTAEHASFDHPCWDGWRRRVDFHDQDDRQEAEHEAIATPGEV
jgi:hypothetical protein